MASDRYKVWEFVKARGEDGATPREIVVAMPWISLESVSSKLLKLINSGCLIRKPETRYRCRQTYRYFYTAELSRPAKTRGPVKPPASQGATQTTEAFLRPTPAMNAFLGIQVQP